MNSCTIYLCTQRLLSRIVKLNYLNIIKWQFLSGYIDHHKKPDLVKVMTRNLKQNILSSANKYSQSACKMVVENDTTLQRFCIDVDGVGQAYLEYETCGNTITLVHTKVPSELSGRGIGKILAKEALEYVRKNKLKLKIECEFVQHFVENCEPTYLQYMI